MLRLAAAESVMVFSDTSPAVDVTVLVPAPDRSMVPMSSVATTDAPESAMFAATSTATASFRVNAPVVAVTFASISIVSVVPVPPPDRVIAPAVGDPLTSRMFAPSSFESTVADSVPVPMLVEAPIVNPPSDDIVRFGLLVLVIAAVLMVLALPVEVIVTSVPSAPDRLIPPMFVVIATPAPCRPRSPAISTLPLVIVNAPTATIPASISTVSSLSLPPAMVAVPETLTAPATCNVAATVSSSSSAVTTRLPAPPSSRVIVDNVTLASELIVRFAAAESVTGPITTSPLVDVTVLVPAPDRLMTPMSSAMPTDVPISAMFAATSTVAASLMVSAPVAAVTLASISIRSPAPVPPPDNVTAPAVGDPVTSSVSLVSLSEVAGERIQRDGGASYFSASIFSRRNDVSGCRCQRNRARGANVIG